MGDFEDLEADEWRDPNISKSSPQNRGGLEDENYANYEADEANRWLDPVISKPAPQNKRREGQAATNALRNSTMPQEVWLIPPNIYADKILGEKHRNMYHIMSTTNTHMQYNAEDAQIEMWGKQEDLEQALKQWNALASSQLTAYENQRKKRKSKGWAKPEKYRTKKQIERDERREKRKNSDYLGFPDSEKPFHGQFIFPDKQIPVLRIIGEKEVVLNPIRAETKCYMWYEPSENILKVVGDTYEDVESATLRIKNLYLKVEALRSIPMHLSDPKKSGGWSLHMIDQPKKLIKVKLASPPSNFTPPYGITTVFKILEPVTEGGGPEPVTGEVDLERKELIRTTQMAALQTINEKNMKKIESALLQALGAIHLFDEEIKMRIRFGHVCLTDFPRDPLWSIDKLTEKILNDHRLQSKFATCIKSNRSDLNPLFEVLTVCKEHSACREHIACKEHSTEECEVHDEHERRDAHEKHERRALCEQKHIVCEKQWEGSPFLEFKIHAKRRRGSTHDDWQCAFDVQFKKEDKKIGLWNAVTSVKHILDLNMICLENDYSWRLSLDTAKRLNNDKHSSQGLFVHRLRLSPQEDLVYTNTDDIRVTSVCQKKKYKHWWVDDYIVEVTEYKFWNCTSILVGIEIILSEAPSRTMYGVTLYRKSWDDDFASNCTLGVGEVPNWHPTNILDKDKTGGIDGLLQKVREFIEILSDKAPFGRSRGE